MSLMGRSRKVARHGNGPATTQYRRGAKALIASGDAVLLVKERHADGTSFWTLPGGGIRSDESLTEGLCRELREELGCRALVVGDRTDRVWYAHRSAPNLVSVYTVFECWTLTDPAPKLADGIEASRWVRPDAIPPRTLPQVRSICW
jgi:8-oxo-dGTP pyrophosphatase MutT (NUDIX family)